MPTDARPAAGPGPRSVGVGYRTLFQGSPFGISLVALDGRVLDTNPAALALHGYPRDQVVGRRFPELDMLFSEDIARLEDVFRRLVSGESLPPVELRVRRPEGETRWIEATCVLLDRDGASYALQVLSRDITKQREAEALLRESLHRYRVLMESAADGIFLADSQGLILEVNARATDVLGYPRDELVGRHVRDLIAPADLVRQPLRLQEIREGKTVRLERVLRHKDGTDVPVEISAKMLDDGRIQGIVRDIADRHEAQAALTRSERRLRTVITGAPLVLFSLDAHGLFTFSAGKGLEKLGLRAGEVVGESVFDLYAGSPDICRAARRALAGETIQQVTEMGELVWDVRYSPIVEDSTGSVAGVVGVATDITERRRAERALRHTEARYRALAENSAVGIWQITPEGHTVYANPTMLELLEVASTDELAGVTYHAFFTPEDQRRIRAEQARRSQGEPSVYEVQIQSAKGTCRSVVVSGAPVLDGRGRVQSLIGTFVDVTDRKLAEEERRRLEVRVRQAQKFESLGILAGGIAHDFNNLLTGVLGNAGLALMRLSPASEVYPIIERIEHAAQQAADLTQQLLAYAGKGRFLIQKIDLSELIRENDLLFRSTVRDGIDVGWDLEDDLPAIEGDAAQIRQLLVNLLANASEACPPEGGAIRVGTRAVELDGGALERDWLGEASGAGRYVQLRIVDNGRGIDQRILANVFDPFYSTKASRRGLGLAAVLGIVRGHDGAVRLLSTVGGGTTFQVVLPAREDRSGHGTAGGSA